jgi:hypothetical protein
VKAVVAQADLMQSDREEGGKGCVQIADAGLLLVWSVGVLRLSCAFSGEGERFCRNGQV